MKQLLLYVLAISFFCASCNNDKKQNSAEVNNIKIGVLEKIDPALDSVINLSALAEIISEGYDWSEGPVWVESQKMLLFSDVPRDTIFKWTEAKRKEVYLTPS